MLESSSPSRVRILAGYAGWGPGQLDAELAQSAWLMTEVESDLIFDVDPAAMWETAIRRLGDRSLSSADESRRALRAAPALL